MQVNGEHLETAIEIALGEHGGSRWRNAVQRGAELLLTNRCLPISPTILLVFSDSGDNYVTDGEECRSTEGLCPAFSHGNMPCKHRAAHRLLQILKAGAGAANEGGRLAA
jgi:hypothetical protein